MSDLILKGSTTSSMSLGSSGSTNMQFSSTTENRLVKMIEDEAAARAAADETLENSKADKDHTHTATEVGALPNTTEIPSKVSQLENDKGYLTEHQDISGKADKATTLEGYGITDAYTKAEIDNKEDDIWNEIDYLIAYGAEKTLVGDIPYEDLLIEEVGTAFCHQMASNHNYEFRLPELTILSIEFENAEYDKAYLSSLSFDSGATPTSIDYSGSGILNWVGTDCTKDGDLSIFQPSANTHYDIVFYFNGSQFIGLVNGFVPATGNVVSE